MRSVVGCPLQSEQIGTLSPKPGPGPSQAAEIHIKQIKHPDFLIPQLNCKKRS